MTGRMKLAGVVLATILVFGLLFGTGRAMADSLPGDLLHTAKVFVEQTRLWMTHDPEKRADLSVGMTERRIDEFTTVYQQTGSVDDAAAKQAMHQITRTVQEMKHIPETEGSQLFNRMRTAIQERQQILVQAMGDRPDPEAEPMRKLFHKLEWARQELQPGAGEPDGQAERKREGTPPEEADMPDPADQPGPGPGPEATKGPGGPNDDTPGSQANEQPADSPGNDTPGQDPGNDTPGQEGNQEEPGPAGPGQESPGPGGAPDSPGNPSQPGGNQNHSQDPATNQDGGQKGKP